LSDDTAIGGKKECVLNQIVAVSRESILILSSLKAYLNSASVQGNSKGKSQTINGIFS